MFYCCLEPPKRLEKKGFDKNITFTLLHEVSSLYKYWQKSSNRLNYSMTGMHLFNQPCSNRRAELCIHIIQFYIIQHSHNSSSCHCDSNCNYSQFLINSGDKLWTCLQHNFKVLFLHRQTLLCIKSRLKVLEAGGGLLHPPIEAHLDFTWTWINSKKNTTLSFQELNKILEKIYSFCQPAWCPLFAQCFVYHFVFSFSKDKGK